MTNTPLPNDGLRDAIENIVNGVGYGPGGDRESAAVHSDDEATSLIMQLIANHDRQLLQTIASRLPKKQILDPINNDAINASTFYFQARGFDKALDQVTTILDEIKGEL